MYWLSHARVACYGNSTGPWADEQWKIAPNGFFRQSGVLGYAGGLASGRDISIPRGSFGNLKGTGQCLEKILAHEAFHVSMPHLAAAPFMGPLVGPDWLGNPWPLRFEPQVPAQIPYLGLLRWTPPAIERRGTRFRRTDKVKNAQSAISSMDTEHKIAAEIEACVTCR